jgi:HSP20 family protein
LTSLLAATETKHVQQKNQEVTMLVRVHRNSFSPFPFDSLIDRFFQGGVQDDGSLFPTLWTPSVDIVEQENAFVIKAELAGVSKDDVKITLHENILTIRGEKKQEKETKESNTHRVERSFGSFQRSFNLPGMLKGDSVEATFADGVLTISIPKAEEAKPKQIEVKVK